MPICLTGVCRTIPPTPNGCRCSETLGVTTLGVTLAADIGGENDFAGVWTTVFFIRIRGVSLIRSRRWRESSGFETTVIFGLSCREGCVGLSWVEPPVGFGLSCPEDRGGLSYVESPSGFLSCPGRLSCPSLGGRGGM
jgi:hypothetical protein